ncbi:MAG: dihydrodipicolinate synthase family protein [Candidatus Caldatribacteriota bacterium]
MEDLKKYEGILVANTTPFDEGGNLNKKLFKDDINYLIDSGIKGFFASGTYGEGPMMSPIEYKEYIETFSEINNGRCTIISQVGATNLKQALEQAKYAEEAKVDAIAAIPPFYYPHDDLAIYKFYEELCNATSLPVFIYNNPERSGNKISPELLKKLSSIPKITGMKDSSGNIKEFMKYKMSVSENFVLLVGDDDYTVSAFLMGAKGAVIVLASLFPEIYIEMFKESKNGNWGKAVQLQFKAIQIRNVLKKGPYVSTYKEVMKLMGRNGGYTKKPLRMPTYEEIKVIKDSLIKLGYLK